MKHLKNSRFNEYSEKKVHKLKHNKKYYDSFKRADLEEYDIPLNVFRGVNSYGCH